MKFKKKVLSLKQFLQEKEIADFLKENNLPCNKEEIESYKEYFDLLHLTGTGTSTITEAGFRQEVQDGQEEDTKSLIGIAKGAAKLVAATTVAGIGGLWWLIKKKKALKLVSKETALKIQKAKAEAKFLKDRDSKEDPTQAIEDKIENLKSSKKDLQTKKVDILASDKEGKTALADKYKIQIEKISDQISNLESQKELAKERKSKAKTEEFDPVPYDDKIDDIKSKIDDIIGSEEPDKSSTDGPITDTKGRKNPKESFDLDGMDELNEEEGNFQKTKAFLFKSVRLERVKGTLAAKQILRDASSDIKKKAFDEEIAKLEKTKQKLEKENADIEAQEKKDLEDASEEEKKAYQDSVKNIDDADKDSEKKSDELEVDTESIDKKIEKLEKAIEDKQDNLKRVKELRDELSKDDSSGAKRNLRKSEEIIAKNEKDIQEIKDSVKKLQDAKAKLDAEDKKKAEEEAKKKAEEEAAKKAAAEAEAKAEADAKAKKSETVLDDNHLKKEIDSEKEALKKLEVEKAKLDKERNDPNKTRGENVIADKQKKLTDDIEGTKKSIKELEDELKNPKKESLNIRLSKKLITLESYLNGNKETETR